MTTPRKHPRAPGALTDLQKAQARQQARARISNADFDDAEVTECGPPGPENPGLYVCPIVWVPHGPAKGNRGTHHYAPTSVCDVPAKFARWAVVRLIVDSVWFAVTPLPDDAYRLEVKTCDVGVMDALMRATARG